MDSLSDDYVDSRLSSERHPRPPMRYRRFGGGYRREDVGFALASLRLALHLLEQMRAIVSDFESTISQVERKELTVPALPVEPPPAEAPQPELEPVAEAVELESAPEPQPEPEVEVEVEAEPQVELQISAELV